jgi:uncharacterized membrane protein YfcA
MAFQFFSAMYGGYFGAGTNSHAGMRLGLLGLNELARATESRTSWVSALTASRYGLFLNGLVVWRDALIMAIGALAEVTSVQEWPCA